MKSIKVMLGVIQFIIKLKLIKMDDWKSINVMLGVIQFIITKRTRHQDS